MDMYMRGSMMGGMGGMGGYGGMTGGYGGMPGAYGGMMRGGFPYGRSMMGGLSDMGMGSYGGLGMGFGRSPYMGGMGMGGMSGMSGMGYMASPYGSMLGRGCMGMAYPSDPSSYAYMARGDPYMMSGIL
ncbi:MAG: hypothetical protein CYPHOPRED_001128 [Cyphobasidiales sp. Tagirdzhanova-0007]|nr:MAG: hypothetical protein CYPHOPRED_001128 [Cyphobasidiales sp. Tagirdzhanova-0007]